MRMEPTRKCARFADVRKFADSELPKGDFGYANTDFGYASTDFGHSNFRDHRLALIDAYGDWLQQWLDQGWDGYLLTFMFNQLPGSRRAMVQQMHQHVENRWYGRLATRMVRKPSSPIWVPFLPKGIFVPDLPVSKGAKQSLRDVSINEGLHMHGVMVANRWVRIPETLDVYFEENLSKFLVGKLRHIDVEQITDSPRYVVGYGMKGLKRPIFSEDDVLVLPRDVSELLGRTVVAADRLGSGRNDRRG